MPRFMVERDFGQVSDDEMQDFVVRSKVVTAERFPDLRWEGSHVCDDAGGFKAFCVYTAPSASVLDEHAAVMGDQGSHRIFEIVGEIDPRDIAA